MLTLSTVLSRQPTSSGTHNLWCPRLSPFLEYHKSNSKLLFHITRKLPVIYELIVVEGAPNLPDL